MIQNNLNIDEKVLSLLRLKSGRFVSGEKISNEVKITRTAIWKHVKNLRKNGYEIEARPSKGYRLISIPDNFNSVEMKNNLATEFIGEEIIVVGETTSTNEIAAYYAENGYPEGTVIISDAQLKGKGRLGRNWFSTPGKSVCASIILRPKIAPFRTPQLSLITGIATSSAICSFTGVIPQLKWPNDLLIGGRKISGILVEMSTDMDMVRHVVIGIGINVNQDSEDFPPDISSIATSLKIEYGRIFNRTELLKKVLVELEGCYQNYLRYGFMPFMQGWLQLSDIKGKNIVVNQPTGVITGKCEGIDEEGAILVRKEDGIVSKIMSGDVNLI